LHEAHDELVKKTVAAHAGQAKDLMSLHDAGPTKTSVERCCYQTWFRLRFVGYDHVMLTQRDVHHDDLDRLTALLDIKIELLGAEHRPLPLAGAAVGSALAVLATSPLTSVFVFLSIAFFLLFAAYLVLMADAEVSRCGAERIAIDGEEFSGA